MGLQKFTTGTQIGAGSIVQVVSTKSSTQTSTSASFALDTSIPQNTEGVEILSVTITPKSASNLLRVSVTVPIGTSTAAQIGELALFRDSDADAIGGAIGYSGPSVLIQVLTITHEVTAGSTNATTFDVRFGSTQGSAAITNDYNGAIWAGSTLKSSIVVTEVAA